MSVVGSSASSRALAVAVDASEQRKLWNPERDRYRREKKNKIGTEKYGEKGRQHRIKSLEVRSA